MSVMQRFHVGDLAGTSFGGISAAGEALMTLVERHLPAFTWPIS